MALSSSPRVGVTLILEERVVGQALQESEEIGALLLGQRKPRDEIGFEGIA